LDELLDEKRVKLGNKEDKINTLVINLGFAEKNNDFFVSLNRLKDFVEKEFVDNNKKYNAYTTKWNKTKKEWTYPKYSRKVTKYLEYDNRYTKDLYEVLADEIIDKHKLDEKTTADNVIKYAHFFLLLKYNPGKNYSTDLKAHSLTEVWESPLFLHHQFEYDDKDGDCDSYGLFFYNILREILIHLGFESELNRLYCAVIEFTNNTRHFLLGWLKGDEQEKGVGLIPLETTYFPDSQTFLDDWRKNRFMTKQRYNIIYLFQKGDINGSN